MGTLAGCTKMLALRSCRPLWPWRRYMPRNASAAAALPRGHGSTFSGSGAMAVVVARRVDVRPGSASASAEAPHSAFPNIRQGVHRPSFTTLHRLGTVRLRSSLRRGGISRMKDFESLGEMILVVHNNLDTLSNRAISAFWTQVLSLLQSRNIGLLDDNPNAAKQIDGILCHTLEGITTNTESFGPRDLSQTTIALARIMKKVEDRRGRLRKGSPHQILHDALIGHNSQNKQFILRELAAAAMPMREEFEPRELSNLVYSFGLAKYVLEFDDGRTSFDVLAGVAISRLENFNGQDISIMLWAYGNVKASNPKLFKGAGDNIASRKSLESFWPQALSNIVWAYATLDEAHPALFGNVADHIVALGSLDEFRPQALSNIVWAYTTLDETHPALFRKVADHIIALDSLKSFDPQALSNIVWAYSTAGVPQPKLYKKLGDHIASLKSLGPFKPQELANTVWAFATSKEAHPAVFRKVVDHIISLGSLDEFRPQALSNIVWAYATAKEPQPKLFKKLGDHVAMLDSLERFQPQHLNNTVWAYATAGEAHPKLFTKVAEAAIAKQKEFIPQNIANLLWAYATNGHIDQNIFKSFAPTAATLLEKYNEQDLGTIAWAYAVADMPAPSLFNEDFIKACQEKEGNLLVENLSQLHQWNLWQEELKSGARLPPSLQQKCYDAFISRMPTPSATQDDVISVLSSMGLQPQEEVLTEKGYRLDALVEVNGVNTGVEVDGPFHFLGRKPNGSTLLKRRQVPNLERIPLVSVPYWEWDKLGNPGKNREKKEQYLRSLLGTG